jgi:replicative DNA helicase
MKSDNQRNDGNHPGMPCAPDAEKGLLGSILQSPAVLDDMGWVLPSYFYNPTHRAIYERMREMAAAGKPIDLVTVSQEFMDSGQEISLNIPSLLAELFTFVPTGANADYYGKILQEKAIQRVIMEAAAQLGRRAAMGDGSPEEMLQDAESTLLGLRNAAGHETCWKPLSDGIRAAVAQIEATYRNRGRPVGLETGIHDFDRMTGGLKGGQLVIVAARPGMGKTCFLLQAARTMGNNVPVAIFSLEMNMVELASRTLCAEMPLNLGRVRDGFMGKQEIPKMMGAAQVLHALPVYIDETPALTIFELRSRARRAVIRHGAKAIFVDYLQLLRSTSKRSQESRAIEVAEISMTLKACAKELNVPVIAAAQLNRDAEHRAGPPKLADLRESGQIEQDADIVLFLHRPKKDSKEAAEREEMNLIIAKHRDGAVGPMSLRFKGEFARFENLTEELYSNNPDKRQKGYEDDE